MVACFLSYRSVTIIRILKHLQGALVRKKIFYGKDVFNTFSKRQMFAGTYQ